MDHIDLYTTAKYLLKAKMLLNRGYPLYMKEVVVNFRNPQSDEFEFMRNMYLSMRILEELLLPLYSSIKLTVDSIKYYEFHSKIDTTGPLDELIRLHDEAIKNRDQYTRSAYNNRFYTKIKISRSLIVRCLDLFPSIQMAEKTHKRQSSIDNFENKLNKQLDKFVYDELEKLDFGIPMPVRKIGFWDSIKELFGFEVKREPIVIPKPVIYADKVAQFDEPVQVVEKKVRHKNNKRHEADVYRDNDDYSDGIYWGDDAGYDPEAWRGSDRSEHYGRSRSNWTDREDWDCDSHNSDGMSGFDSYEENDF